MVLTNNLKTPASPLVPTELDQGADNDSKSLMAMTGGHGAMRIAATQSYRNDASPALPTLAIYSDAAINLTGVVFLPGKEWRDNTGAVLTTLALPANQVHFVFATKFTNAGAGAIIAPLAAPWTAIIP